MFKLCTKCRQEKKLSEFHASATVPDGFMRQCKKCHSEINRQHYLNNKDKYKDSSVKNKQKYREWFRDIKRTLSCSICGDDKPWRLDFHHPNDDKENNVSCMISDGRSKEIVLEEIAKCQVVCKNCHADIHHSEQYT